MLFRKKNNSTGSKEPIVICNGRAITLAQAIAERDMDAINMFRVNVTVEIKRQLEKAGINA